jgi:nitric oxide reductase subunit C
MYTRDPAFWRAGAIATSLFMSAVLVILTVNSLEAIMPGGSHVPLYDVINRHISYDFDAKRGEYVPKIGGEELLFNHKYTESEARALIGRGKMVIQSRACIDCHTFFGNGGYYAPDLTRAWLDPVWAEYPGTKRGDAIAAFLMHPFRLGYHEMPNLHLSRDEARAAVAYLKWMSSVDTNGFPNGFGVAQAK